MPLISVVMSVYNSSLFLKECIKSILEQTFKDYELIILDDGSSDNSIDIIKTFSDTRIKFIACQHDYIQTLNMGINMTKGKYIAHMDSDDIMLPNRLEVEYKFMEENQNIDVCGSNIGEVDNPSYCSNIDTQHKEIVSKLVLGCTLFHPTVIIRKSSIQKTFFENGQFHLYNPDYIYAEDYKLWVDMLINGFIFGGIKEKLVNKRVSDRQITNIHKEEVYKQAKKVQIDIAEYVEKIIRESNNPKLISYYDFCLEMLSKKIITTRTFQCFLSNLYLYYFNMLS